MTGTWLTEDVFVQQIPAPYTLNSVQWVKLYSNLPISDPRQVSWGHSHAVHEVVKSQLNLVQLHRINQDILGPDQIIPWKYLLISFFHFQCPFCVCVCMCVNITVSVWQTEWSRGAREKWVRFHLRAHDWRPTLASPGVCCCWQESMAPCSLTESWHRFHSTAAHNSHAIALLHQQ